MMSPWLLQCVTICAVTAVPFPMARAASHTVDHTACPRPSAASVVTAAQTLPVVNTAGAHAAAHKLVMTMPSPSGFCPTQVALHPADKMPRCSKESIAVTISHRRLVKSCHSVCCSTTRVAMCCAYCSTGFVVLDEAAPPLAIISITMCVMNAVNSVTAFFGRPRLPGAIFC